MNVLFNNPEEFVQELQLMQGLFAPPILRISHRQRRSDGPYSHQSVVATVLVAPVRGGNQIVRLDAYCGQRWGEGFAADGETIEKAKKIEADLRAAAAALELEVRGGVYEECS